MTKSFVIVIALMLMTAGLLAEENYDIWLWGKANASKDSRVLKIEEHHACSGSIVLIRSNRFPAPDEGPFEGEKVIELSENGDILNRWYMPVDEIVLGVEGSFIISGLGNSEKALKIGTDRSLRYTTASKFEANLIDCPTSAKIEFI